MGLGWDGSSHVREVGGHNNGVTRIPDGEHYLSELNGRID